MTAVFLLIAIFLFEKFAFGVQQSDRILAAASGAAPDRQIVQHAETSQREEILKSFSGESTAVWRCLAPFNQDRDIAICSICMEGLTDPGDIVTTFCNHFFHNDCMTNLGKSSAYRHHPRCPNCRASFLPMDGDVDFEQGASGDDPILGIQILVWLGFFLYAATVQILCMFGVGC